MAMLYLWVIILPKNEISFKLNENNKMDQDTKLELKQLANSGKNINHVLRYACNRGYLDDVKFLYEECGCDPHENDILWGPSMFGHLDIIKYLHETHNCTPQLTNGNNVELENYRGIFEYDGMLKYFIDSFGINFNSFNMNNEYKEKYYKIMDNN